MKISKFKVSSVRRWNCKKFELQGIKCKRVDIAIVRREKAHVHIVNVRGHVGIV